MTSKKDYYEILGIKKGAPDQEIKSAYRKLAREHHPDMVAAADKKDAESRFKEINEAYQILSDPQKRKMYDQFGHAAGANSGPAGAGAGGAWGPFSYSYNSNNADFGNVDPFEIFEEVFGFRGFGGARRPTKGKNLYYEMKIEFVDTVKGLEKTIKIESGEVTIKIPKGVSNGTEIRFAGKGMPAQGLPNGDLFITVLVELPKQFFDRSGATLAAAQKIEFVDAILGTEIEVPVIDSNSANGIGKTKLKIPAGTQSNTHFKLKGKGMPEIHGNGTGDVIVKIIVEIPNKINSKQKKILEEYRRL